MEKFSIFCPAAAACRFGSRCRNQPERPRRILVNIRMPTGGQRQPIAVSQPGAQYSHIAGTGDVNQVWLKRFNALSMSRMWRT